MYRRAILAALWLLTAPLAQADVELNEATRANFGIATIAAEMAQVLRQWQASAQVLDASALVSILAETSAAQAAATASTSELKRVTALHQSGNNAALKTVEAARAQAIADHSRVTALQAQLLGSWGSSISRMTAAQREQLMQSILDGEVVLLRAELPGSTITLSPRSVRLRFLSESNSINAKLLGAMPQTNSQSLGKAYLLSAPTDDQSALQPGQVLSAELEDATRSVSGIKLPRAAVLRWQGQQWVYVEHEAGHYQRVAITVTQWLDEAVLVTADIKSGDKVVNRGAGLVLGAELLPPEAKGEAEE
ncbi:MAG: hypothetical protein AB7F79_06185 [Steroidobacteraceae bacterium]